MEAGSRGAPPNRSLPLELVGKAVLLVKGLLGLVVVGKAPAAPGGGLGVKVAHAPPPAAGGAAGGAAGCCGNAPGIPTGRGGRLGACKHQAHLTHRDFSVIPHMTSYQ